MSRRRVCEKSDVPRLGAALRRVGSELEHKGETLWTRSHDWSRIHTTGGDSTRGGGLGDDVPDEVVADRIDESVASRYHDEVVALLNRMEADEHRLTKLLHIICPERPPVIGNRDILAAQAAADGWCISCFRDDQHLQPITRRPSTGEPYYRDRCRACGEWKAETGDDPPIDVLRTRHQGGRVRLRSA